MHTLLWPEALMISGAMYSIVPISELERSPSRMPAFASPKSVTRMWPSESNSTFSCRATAVFFLIVSKDASDLTVAHARFCQPKAPDAPKTLAAQQHILLSNGSTKLQIEL